MSKVLQLNNQSGGFGAWLIHCPACRTGHAFDARWTFNGNIEKPTFRDSMLVYEVKPHNDFKGHPRCHSYVTDGEIKYLDDSTHALKGQTIPLPDWDNLSKERDL